MRGIFIWKQFKVDTLKAESFAPLGAAGLGQLAGESRLTGLS